MQAKKSMNKLFYVPDGGLGGACFLESPASTVELLDVNLHIAVGILWENKVTQKKDSVYWQWI